MYMQIKYSGDKPIISQHGITFNTTKEDKYVYIEIQNDNNELILKFTINHYTPKF